MKLNSVLISIWGKIVLSSVYISIIVFLGFTIIVVGVAFVFDHYNKGFGVNVLVEAHGMLFDILVIGVFILALNKFSEKRMENQKYRDEIDDFRGWKSEEAAFRITGNIKRLNRNGFRGEIDLSGCHLVSVNLRYVDISGADLHSADLTGSRFYGADLRCASLIKSTLAGARLGGAKLGGAELFDANLEGADLRDVRGVTIEQLFEVKSLFGALLDPELMELVKEKCPQLLEKPKEG